MMHQILVILVLCTFFASPTESGEKARSAPSALVQSIAGIRVGPNHSVDNDVIEAFGPGLFTDDEGHGGGRYFTDPNRTITLHVEIGVDHMIDHVELTSGISLPKGLNASDPIFVSQALPATPKIDHDLRLGMSPSEILKILGRPKKDDKGGGKRTIVYEATEEDHSRVLLYYEARFTFVADRLTKISIYDGE